MLKWWQYKGGAGVTINPVAFIVINKENVKLIPVNHSSALDKLLDYVPDLLEKTSSIMNKCLNDKKEEAKEILKKMKDEEKERVEEDKKNDVKKVTIEKKEKPEEIDLFEDE